MAVAQEQIKFSGKLNRPGGKDKGAPWIFMNLPDEASKKLPSRSMVSVEGTIDAKPFHVTLEPDGNGGHWFKVDEELQASANLKPGSTVDLVIAPMKEEPEPKVPEDFQAALASAPEKARTTWAATTAVARRDWISWISSGKKAETRGKRIEVAMSKLDAGSKRACCFDRSGMYSKEMSCPVADSE